MEAQNKFKKVWEDIERPETQPSFANDIIQVDYGEFERKVIEQDPKFVEASVKSLYSGDIYLLKGGFSKEFMYELIEKVDEYWKRTPSSFHKMLEGCPDYHRIQDEEVAKNYVFRSVRHSCYFFHWNGDPLGIIPTIMKRWGIFKFLGGYRFNEYESNTPADGVVDRIQIARYLPRIGISETHCDPYQNQRFFISGFMSKRGIDYEAGGFYVVGKSHTFIDVEDEIEVGDIGIGYATVLHGVDRIDPGREADWNSKDGRWWLGLYSNSSDMVQNRATGEKVEIDLRKS